MRRILISMLLVSAAASPAFAAQDPDHNNQSGNNHPQAHQQRAPANSEARDARGPSRPYYAPQQRGGMQAANQQGGGRPQYYSDPRFQGRGPNGYAGQRNAYAGNYGAYEQQRNAYAQQRGAYEQQRQAYEQGRQRAYRGGNFGGAYGSRNGLPVSNQPRFGTQPPFRGDSRRLDQLNWNRNWRSDERYNWRDYRENHRSRFHLGYYVDPFGWGYQSFAIGYRMWPEYYGNQYWLDPQMYELPFPPPGCAWVRYWNDAVLVDTYSGTVVDVIPAFFW